MYRPYSPERSRELVLSPADLGLIMANANQNSGSINGIETSGTVDHVTCEEEYIVSNDGHTSLHTYFLHCHKDDKGSESGQSGTLSPSTAILMLHGNAGNIGHRLLRAAAMAKELGCHVLLLSYRGYGYSEGTPHMQGLKQDAMAGLRHLYHKILTSAKKQNSVRIYLLGHSLGGAVTMALASANARHADTEQYIPIQGIILENTFVSIKRLIKDIAPPLFTWLHMFFRDEESNNNSTGDSNINTRQHRSGGLGRAMESWNNVTEIRKLATSIAASKSTPFPSFMFLLGEKDELFPQTHMWELYRTVDQLCALHNQQHDSVNKLSSSPYQQQALSATSDQKNSGCKVMMRVFPGGDHIHTSKEPGFLDAIKRFITDCDRNHQQQSEEIQVIKSK